MIFRRPFHSREASSSQRADVSMTGIDSQHRIDKASRLIKKNGSFRDAKKAAKLQRSLTGEDTARMKQSQKPVGSVPVMTLMVGREGRLFAAHQDVLARAPFFEKVLRSGCFESQNRRIALPDEDAEIFSAVLEYLYKGDYYPRLLQGKNRDSWKLEDSLLSSRATPQQGSPMMNELSHRDARAQPATEATIFLPSCGEYILRDTVIYCAAERYGLEELKRIALLKQGLQTGIDVGTILRSAQYCYAQTSDSDGPLRAHYLSLIIRCRKTFKRSGTMQAEMEKCGSGVYGEGGGKLFFDLFVALCNHLDDIIDASNARTPKTA